MNEPYILGMRILHFSDHHGQHLPNCRRLIRTYRPDWIVLTGDILPDFPQVNGKGRQLALQREWWAAHREAFTSDSAVTTLVVGNHELEGFRDRSLEVIPPVLKGKVATLVGVPAEFGAWGYSREFGDEALERETRGLGRPWVVLSHCPPYGWLDREPYGQSIGHRPLRRFLDESPDPPLLLLCGHVHPSFGDLRQGRTLMVNAATGWALIQLDLQLGAAAVLEMKRMDATPTGGDA
jgi:Icc-related predicted phosphoesterase